MSASVNIFESFWELGCAVFDFFRAVGPVQSFLYVAAAAAGLFVGVAAYWAFSGNPKHHPDEYVKANMHVFDSWFLKHPEDRARYE